MATSGPDLATFIKQRRKEAADVTTDDDTAVDNSKTKPDTETAEAPAILPLNKEGAWAAVGFAVVLIALGLPVWWRTTTVYRADLPYDSVQQMAPLRRQHFLPIRIMESDYRVGQHFSQRLGDQMNKLSTVKYSVHYSELRKEQVEVLESSDSREALVSGLLNTTSFYTATLSVLLLDPAKSKLLLDGKRIHVTRENLLLVDAQTDVATVATVIRRMSLDESHGGNGDSALSPVAPQSNTRRQNTVASHKVVSEASYSLTITVMLPQPHLIMAHWNSKAAVQAYLSPLLRQLEEINMRVSVRCQQLFMTPLSGVKPQWLSKQQHYAVPHHQLPLAINAIEAKLGSFVSTDPSLHFIVYIPGQDQTPLHIYTKDNAPLASNSFVVPRWGGVIIHNPPSNLPQSADSSGDVTRFPLDEHVIMNTILTQLHTLLPIPQLEETEDVSIAPMRSPELSQWQLDALTRTRVSQYYDTTTTTLQSLHELVGEISNMVVSDEVGGWVWRSVEDWLACADATQEGRLREASRYCTHAHANAHAAFFHPSMLALLYFPDNQKYAIYVPLFLPVSIPVLLSFKMLYSLAKSHWTKQKKD